MKKISLLCVCLMSIVLSGCFQKKEIISDPIVIKQQVKDTQVVSGDVEDAIGADEFDGNGEFDPAKFNDEDINEVMDLMKELVEE